MNKIEAAEFLNAQLLTRWPMWRPSRQEIQDWMVWLQMYDYRAAQKAAMEHARTSRFFKRPVTGDFFEICDVMQKEYRSKTGQMRTAPVEPTVFVVCTEPNEKTHRPRVGMRYAVRPYPKDADVMLCAEGLRKQCQTLHGGQWIIQR